MSSLRSAILRATVVSMLVPSGERTVRAKGQAAAAKRRARRREARIRRTSIRP
jgi:hypothetical protein